MEKSVESTTARDQSTVHGEMTLVNRRCEYRYGSAVTFWNASEQRWFAAADAFSSMWFFR